MKHSSKQKLQAAAHSKQSQHSGEDTVQEGIGSKPQTHKFNTQSTHTNQTKENPKAQALHSSVTKRKRRRREKTKAGRHEERRVHYSKVKRQTGPMIQCSEHEVRAWSHETRMLCRSRTAAHQTVSRLHRQGQQAPLSPPRRCRQQKMMRWRDPCSPPARARHRRLHNQSRHCESAWWRLNNKHTR